MHKIIEQLLNDPSLRAGRDLEGLAFSEAVFCAWSCD